MALFLFALIAWIIIIIFALVPKGLSIIENFIIFFCTTIIELTISTTVSLNLKLIKYSNLLQKYISVLIERNIIAPLCVLIFINLLFFFKGRFKKISIAVFILGVLSSVELLGTWAGIKVYKGWNMIWDSIAALILMTLSTLLAVVVKKIK